MNKCFLCYSKMNIPQVMPQGPVVMTQVPMQQQPVVNTVMVNSQGQPMTGPPQAQENNISKVKSLIGPLRESLAVSFIIYLLLYCLCVILGLHS